MTVEAARLLYFIIWKNLDSTYCNREWWWIETRTAVIWQAGKTE
jgi:hypothetical protein